MSDGLILGSIALAAIALSMSSENESPDFEATTRDRLPTRTPHRRAPVNQSGLNPGASDWGEGPRLPPTSWKDPRTGQTVPGYKGPLIETSYSPGYDPMGYDGNGGLVYAQRPHGPMTHHNRMAQTYRRNGAWFRDAYGRVFFLSN